MLPTKIENHLFNKFGNRYLALTETHIIDYLSNYDTIDNIKQIFIRDGNITKIIYNLLDKKPIINFTSDTNTERIIKQIREDPSKNYHDYFTTFNIIQNHIIYDCIVEVNYRYVYS